MLSIVELCQLTGLNERYVRYWITHDDNFVKSFFKKAVVRMKNSKLGFYYNREMYVIDEADITRIVEYLNNKNGYKIPRNKWSDIAIHCYERKMRCEGCCFEPYCSKFTHPPLKKKVLEFIRLYGEPIK